MMKFKASMAAITLSCGLMVTLMITGVAAAHHSVAAVELDKTAIATGTVKVFEWTNPHAWIWVEVPDGKGGSQDMGFECASLTMLRRGGWTRDMLKPGDKVTVSYHPLRDGKTGGMFVDAEFADGSTISSMLKANQ